MVEALHCPVCLTTVSHAPGLEAEIARRYSAVQAVADTFFSLSLQLNQRRQALAARIERIISDLPDIQAKQLFQVPVSLINFHSSCTETDAANVAVLSPSCPRHEPAVTKLGW